MPWSLNMKWQVMGYTQQEPTRTFCGPVNWEVVPTKVALGGCQTSRLCLECLIFIWMLGIIVYLSARSSSNCCLIRSGQEVESVLSLIWPLGMKASITNVPRGAPKWRSCLQHPLRPQSIHRMALSSYELEILDVLQQKILAPRFYYTAKLIRGKKNLADMHSRLVLSNLRS